MPGHVEMEERLAPRRARAGQLTMAAGCLIGAHILLWLLLRGVIREPGVNVLLALAAAQCIVGVLAVIAGVQLRRADGLALARGSAVAAVLVGVLASLSAPPIWLAGATHVMFRGLDEVEFPSLASP